ncbi:MAG: TAXI family TRAP transporter solute-binding subunit [Burkholderiales bacterium]|jgi:TRAP transporter TAXI family solute receptor|nr:TAXI family TRAP transporter solute-binding subunit [Burkholderiales bacterium]
MRLFNFFMAFVATSLVVGCATTSQTTPKPSLGQVGIYSAGKGSAFLPYAEGAAKYLISTTNQFVVAIETRGSIENLQRINKENNMLGIAFMGTVYEAHTGTGSWTKGEKLSNLRALFPIYETSFQMVALNSSGIKTLAQLDGKKVGVGPAGGPAESFFKGLVEELGLKPTLVNGTPADLAKDLSEGKIDVLWQGAPPPIPAIKLVADQGNATVFGLNDKELSAMKKLFPFLASVEIPANTYKNQSGPLKSVAGWNFFVVHKDFPEADAYLITRAMLSAKDPAKEIHPTAASTLAKNATTNDFLPFHPGALQFYNQAGIKGLK